MSARLIEITVRVLHRTASEVLVDFGGDEAVWLDRARCAFAPAGADGLQVLFLPETLALEKGLA